MRWLPVPPCSATSGTVFEATSLPLTRCFLAIQLLTQTKGNVPALELTRRLGVSYRTAPRGSSSTSGCANSMPSDRSCRAGPVAAAVPSAAVTTARVRHRTEAAPQST